MAPPGLKRLTLKGLSGYGFVGSENSALNQNQGSRISARTASEGVLFLDRGPAVYEVLVVAAHLAGAKAFLASFRAV
jgi:hypothetical protein